MSEYGILKFMDIFQGFNFSLKLSNYYYYYYHLYLKEILQTIAKQKSFDQYFKCFAPVVDVKYMNL